MNEWFLKKNGFKEDKAEKDAEDDLVLFNSHQRLLCTIDKFVAINESLSIPILSFGPWLYGPSLLKGRSWLALFRGRECLCLFVS